MSEVNPNGAITLRDIAADLDEKSAERAVIDLMNKRSDIWDDVINIEANQGRTHKVFYRTGLPKVSFVRLYGGVESSKSSEASATLTLTAIESKMELAKRLLEWYPDAASRITREGHAHADALTLGYVREMLYGSKRLNPDSFNGLATIYNAAGSNNPDDISYNCISVGGSASDASLASLFLVGHGEEGFVNVHPQGHPTAGVEVSEMYEDSVHEAGNPKKTYRAKLQDFTLSGAPLVVDWHKCGRLCNFARYQTFTDNEARKTAAHAFFAALNRLALRVDEWGVRQNWYMDKGALEQIEDFATALTRENIVSTEQVNGRKVTYLKGIPIRINQVQHVAEEFVA